jgi:hypothetical protein
MRRLGAVLAMALAACSSSPKKGGYYKDDGPGANPPANLASIPDAKPRSEPLHKYANRPYEVFGKKYVPLASVQSFHQRGIACASTIAARFIPIARSISPTPPLIGSVSSARAAARSRSMRS